jgi:hypothetical protein
MAEERAKQMMMAVAPPGKASRQCRAVFSARKGRRDSENARRQKRSSFINEEEARKQQHSAAQEANPRTAFPPQHGT